MSPSIFQLYRLNNPLISFCPHWSCFLDLFSFFLLSSGLFLIVSHLSWKVVPKTGHSTPYDTLLALSRVERLLSVLHTTLVYMCPYSLCARVCATIWQCYLIFYLCPRCFSAELLPSQLFPYLCRLLLQFVKIILNFNLILRSACNSSSLLLFVHLIKVLSIPSSKSLKEILKSTRCKTDPRAQPHLMHPSSQRVSNCQQLGVQFSNQLGTHNSLT